MKSKRPVARRSSLLAVSRTMVDDRNLKVQVVSFDNAHAQATVSITY